MKRQGAGVCWVICNFFIAVLRHLRRTPFAGGRGRGIEDDSMRARYFLAIVQITSGPGSRIAKFGLLSGKSCLYLSARRPGKHFVGEGCPLA